MIRPLAYRPVVPEQARNRPAVVHLPDSVRGMGIYLVAGRGSGKSRCLGRIICTQDCLRGVPQVIWDAAGGTIDNFLDKIRRLPPPRQAEVWPRIRYVEMSGKFGYVVPWPVYEQQPGDTLYETAQRYLEVIKRLDPDLITASIEGWNALWEVGTHVGMALTALGGQITEAADVLGDPEGWATRLMRVTDRHPELHRTVKYLTGLAADKSAERRTKSFLNKVSIFSLDPTMTAMFGAATSGVDWAQVVARGETVLLDFRLELDDGQRQLKMLCIFRSLLNYVKRRGAGRHKPIGLVIDELTTLFHFGGPNDSRIFADDLDHVINVVARQFSVWPTLCHQEKFQIDKKTQKTLMGMGTKIIGATQDMEAALLLAEELFPYDPRRIKRYEPVYGGLHGHLIDLQPVEWSIQEQQHLAAQLFTQLRPFHFLVKPAVGEGDVTGQLLPLSIENIDRGVWVDEAAVQELREQLLPQGARRVDEVLAEVQARHRRFLLGDAVPAIDQTVVEPEPAPPPDGNMVNLELPFRKEIDRRYEGDVDDLASFRESAD